LYCVVIRRRGVALGGTGRDEDPYLLELAGIVDFFAAARRPGDDETEDPASLPFSAFSNLEMRLISLTLVALGDTELVVEELLLARGR